MRTFPALNGGDARVTLAPSTPHRGPGPECVLCYARMKVMVERISSKYRLSASVDSAVMSVARPPSRRDALQTSGLG